MGVKKMNRLRNKEYQVGYGIDTPTTYNDFIEALKLINELVRAGLVDLA